MKSLKDVFAFMGFATLVWAVGMAFHACGTAQGSGSTAVSFQGPNGTTCYVVYDSGRAVGGNCQ